LSSDPSPLYVPGRYLYDAMVASVKPKTGNFEFIGTNVKRFDAYPKASGQGLYSRDVSFPNMLYGKFLTCPYPHASVDSIDITKAQALPGVRAIYTYLSTDAVSPTTIPLNKIVTSQGLPLIPQEAKWEGEYSAVAVCAESEEICDAALELISTKWKQLPFYTTVDAAKSDSTRLALEANVYRNLITSDFPNYKEDSTFDVAAGLKAADVTISDTLRLHQYPHTGAEPDSIVAKWEGDALTLWMHTQTFQAGFDVYATLLGIPGSKVKLVVSYNGGMFGQGQLCSTQSYRLFLMAGIFSAKTGLPVKMQMSRKDYLYGSEAEGVHTFTIGAKNDGTITAVKGDFVIGQGAPGGSGTLWASTNHVMNWVRYDLTCPYTAHYMSYETNTQPKWWNRSEQNQNARFLQAVIDRTADALGLDPTDVYLKNARRAAPSATGVVQKGKQLVGWSTKWHKPGALTLSNGHLHGLGFYVGHSWGNYIGQSGSPSSSTSPSAGLRINPNGTVTLIGVKDDVGCSEHTTYAMIVAEEMGMKFEDVYFPLQDTTSGHTPQASGGAAGCHGNSWLFAKLGIQAKASVLSTAATALKTTADKLDMKDSVIFVKSTPTTTLPMSKLTTAPIEISTSVTGLGWAEENMGGIFTPFHCYQALFPEVEVDPNTGEVDVTNVVLAYDVGKALRPATVEGQLYGQAFMAVHRAVESSDIIFDPQTGVRLNADFLNTHISTTLDCGPINPAWMEVTPSDGAYGNTGVGEMNIAIACAIISAVHNATGKWIDPPITPDRVLRALGKA
jgi:CO/xanthine dehydrogenase Mo-binding subunit